MTGSLFATALNNGVLPKNLSVVFNVARASSCSNNSRTISGSFFTTAVNNGVLPYISVVFNVARASSCSSNSRTMAGSLFSTALHNGVLPSSSGVFNAARPAPSRHNNFTMERFLDRTALITEALTSTLRWGSNTPSTNDLPHSITFIFWSNCIIGSIFGYRTPSRSSSKIFSKTSRCSFSSASLRASSSVWSLQCKRIGYRDWSSAIGRLVLSLYISKIRSIGSSVCNFFRNWFSNWILSWYHSWRNLGSFNRPIATSTDSSGNNSILYFSTKSSNNVRFSWIKDCILRTTCCTLSSGLWWTGSIPCSSKNSLKGCSAGFSLYALKRGSSSFGIVIFSSYKRKYNIIWSGSDESLVLK